MNGLNIQHFASLIVRPTLRGMAQATGRPFYSKAAERLLIGTAIQESRLRHLRQLGSGPALGLYQIEPATHQDVWENWVRHRDEVAAFLQLTVPWHKGAVQIRPEDAEREVGRGGVVFGWPRDHWLVSNLVYATAIARLVYYRQPYALPDAHDLPALGAYWKRHYNTIQGAGTSEEFVRNFERAWTEERNR